NPEVRRLISKQTQTEAKESAGPPVTSSRPINVQCNDCQVSFSDLNKLLSHPCRIAFPSNVSKTDLPLFSASSFPHPPPVQAISQSTTNGIAPFFCQECGLDFDEKHLFEAHLLTPRHKFSAGRRGSVSRNAPIIFPNPSLEQTEKVSSLAFVDASHSNPGFPHEDIVDKNRCFLTSNNISRFPAKKCYLLKFSPEGLQKATSMTNTIGSSGRCLLTLSNFKAARSFLFWHTVIKSDCKADSSS
ncbi:hypothetical protein TSMEX_008072, partial [Taenia solium]